jgi:hypothetical protein
MRADCSDCHNASDTVSQGEFLTGQSRLTPFRTSLHGRVKPKVSLTATGRCDTGELDERYGGYQEQIA